MWRWYDNLSGLDESFWLERVLEQLRPSPFLTPSFLKPWSASFAKEIRVGVWKERGLIMFHRKPNAWELLGGQDVADRLDGLCADEEFWRSLRRQARQWNAPLEFPNLAYDSEALRHRDPSDILELTDRSPFVPLGGSFTEYLQALVRKSRHELKRKIAKAEREAADGLTLRSGLEHLETFLHLHRLSSPDKRSFMQDEVERFFRALCLSLDRAGMLGLQVLFAGETPLAALMEIRFAGVVHLYNSGYDPTYSPLSPGLVLIAKSIEQACLEGFREYDFLRGDERYKYHLGGRDREVFKLTWF